MCLVPRALLALALSGSACASPAALPVPHARPDAAAWLPRASGRCLVVIPSQLAPARVEQVVPISQSDGLPYRLGLTHYARVEQAGGRVEVLQFSTAPPLAVVRVQLSQLLAQRACGGPAGCEPVRTEWLDPRTLRVQRGHVDAGESPCAELLRAQPDALELAVRPPTRVSEELRETRVLLAARTDGIERTSTRTFASEEAAARTLRAALRGSEELPSLSGVPAEDLGERVGNAIVQRTFVSFADLELALDDRARRAQRAVDPSDLASVYALFDEAPEPHEELLLAARGRAPHDDGLLRRHFQLLLARDPHAALALAEEGQGEAWQLRKRAALARYDEPALARALVQAHAQRDGARMARELAGQPFVPFADPAPAQQRAEYAFLAAQRIARARVVRSSVTWRVPVLELPRILSTLADAAEPSTELAVELLVYSEREGPASTLGAGRPAQLFSAAGDAQLRTLGGALAAATDDGPFELRLCFGQRSTIALSGRREGGWLFVEAGSRVLRALRFDVLERLLAAPLRNLTGSAFPPDELSIEARDPAELGQLEQSAARVGRCTRSGLTLRCRGGLADASAARRALLAVVHDLLGEEARLLAFGPDTHER